MNDEFIDRQVVLQLYSDTRCFRNQSTYQVKESEMMLLKDIRAGVGVSTVNKVWPGWCISIPYPAAKQNKGN